MEQMADPNSLQPETHPIPVKRKRRGFTLAEVAMASAVLTIAAGGLMSSIVASMALNRVNNETSLAQTYARRAIERMQGVEFADIFRTFNGNAGDDPGGAGTAAGANFEAFGLEPLATDADGLPGEITFPTVDVGGIEQLREDIDDPALGMPRDLNGDGAPIDALNHAADYTVLPVRVRVQWRGAAGPRTITVETLLTTR
jgi:prepilin-type N-terminal cleavage/methylation domain-containing protein